MRFPRQRGATSVLVTIFIPDNSRTDGKGLTGLTNASTNLQIAYRREFDAAATVYTGANIQQQTTIGTFQQPTANTQIRFKEIDSTNFPGEYELQFHDTSTAFGTGDASQHIIINIIELTTTALHIGPCAVQIPLTAWNWADGVRLGLTALPNTACTTNGSLITQGTGAAQLNTDGTGASPVALGQALSAAPTSNSVGEALLVSDMQRGRINTAQAGGASTITLDAGASSTALNYVGDGIILTGGTGGGLPGTGQFRTIIAYNTSTKVATVNRPWETNPDATTTFMMLPRVKSDVFMWESTATPVPATAGVPDVNAKNINNVAAATPPTTAQIATSIWQDATAGDFTTASSIGKSLYNAFTANTSVFTSAALANAPTGGSAPTAAQVATAVWQDVTAGDFTVANSIGKSLYTSGVVPGGSGGLFIAGTNDHLTVTNNLLVSGASTFTGAVTASNASNNVAVNVVAVNGSAVTPGVVDANIVSLANNVITAASISAAALNGKGDWLTFGAYSAPPSAASIATAVWQDTTPGDFTVAGSIGKGLSTGGNAPGAASGLAIVGSNVGQATSVSGAVGSVAGNVGGNVVGSVGSVTGNLGGNLVGNVQGNITGNLGGNVNGNVVGNVTGSVNNVVTNVGGNVTGSVGSVLGAVGSVTGNVGGSVASVLAGVALSSVGMDSILVESGISAGPNLVNDSNVQLTAINIRQALAVWLSGIAGFLAGAPAPGTFTTRAAGSPTGPVRLTEVVDINGNRSGVAIQVPN